MTEVRIEIIARILDTFGVYEDQLIGALARGESLASYLRKECAIYPKEYSDFINVKLNNLGDLATNLNVIVTTVNRKMDIFNLYKDYCEYFLGEYISFDTLESWTSETYKCFDLRDENGYIDYTPGLSALGIMDIDQIAKQYKTERMRTLSC